MSPEDVSTYICEHIDMLWPDNYLHEGEDEHVSISLYHAYLRTDQAFSI